MRIGELSERTGVSVRMLRHYEQLGLLAPERLPNGYRVYTDDDAVLVSGLRCLADLGLDLRTAASVARLGCGLEAPVDSDERATVRRLVRDQLDEVERRRRALDATRVQLADLLDLLEDGEPTPAPAAGSAPGRGR